MPLATLRGFLLLELGYLALDCLCCALCRGQPCLANSDCPQDCSCVSGQCRRACTQDLECPTGYRCLDGVCFPACQGETCQLTADCALGCSCVDNQCWPNSDLYFCVWESAPSVQEDPDCDPDVSECPERRLTRQEIFDCENDPACRDTLPERNCQRGRPEDEDRIHDGPYLTYTECCGRSCKCLYRCQADTACTPWPTGEYEDENECNANCGSSEDVGACCETRRLRDENDDVYRYERGPAPEPCPRTRSACFSEEDIQRTFRPTITDCALCPSTGIGACCTEEGCVDMSTVDPTKPIDRFECENVLNGEFKTTWIDCRQPRDRTISTEFACEDCNGRFDCDCDVPDHCVNRRCVPCLDQVIEVPVVAAPLWFDTGIPVAAGATVTLIAKQCEDLEWGTTIRSQVGEGLLQTGGPNDQYVADQAGTLQVRLERQGQPASGQVCLRITPPQPPCPALGIAFTVANDGGDGPPTHYHSNPDGILGNPPNTAEVGRYLQEEVRGLSEFDITNLIPSNAAQLEFSVRSLVGLFPDYPPPFGANNIAIYSYQGDNAANIADYNSALGGAIGGFNAGGLQVGAVLTFDVTNALNAAIANGWQSWGILLRSEPLAAEGAIVFENFKLFFNCNPLP